MKFDEYLEFSQACGDIIYDFNHDNEKYHIVMSNIDDEIEFYKNGIKVNNWSEVLKLAPEQIRIDFMLKYGVFGR